MQPKSAKQRYLDVLKKKVMIFDGAMGTNLQSQHITLEHYGGANLVGCYDCLILHTPEVVEKVHRSFLEVGVDVIETNTFRASRITLAEFGLGQQALEINQSAAALARRLADEYSTPDHPRFTAGSMGPTGKLPSSIDPQLSNISFDELLDVYREQALGLIQGGVDLLLIETAHDILEVKAAILGIQQAFIESGMFLPIQAQVTLDTNGRMLLGTDISAVLAILEGMPIDVIGLNCSTGPEHMHASIRYLAEHSHLPVSCLPNAGIPTNIKGEAVYPLLPQDFAQELTDFVDKYKINIVGGCCGTTPEHLRKLVIKLNGKSAPQRQISPRICLSSAMQAVDLVQQPAPLIIGERLNTQGSRQFKKAILDQDWEGALALARQQMESGAHALDVCVALTEKSGEAETMQKLIKLISASIDAPLVIDSTDPGVMEVALKACPGKCLLNSVNLEGGREKADRIFDLARQFNAAVICLTIDEHGMAKNAQRKLEVAERIFKIATQDHQLAPSNLVFDPLTFTLASGDAETAVAGVETLNAIPQIKKKLPSVFTSLGISNISYGLSKEARGVLNSVMLYHAVRSGLDLAILNPVLITPYAVIPEQERKLAEDLIFNRNPHALQDFIHHFDIRLHPPTESSIKVRESKPTLNERIRGHILNRIKEGMTADLDEAILSASGNSNENALRVLNQILLPAMQAVGDQFSKGELILPFVLQSAEVMKAAVNHLEKYLDHGQTTQRGRMVLATVYGDVHDIGKNLVRTILANNGYEIIDLGKQVPAEHIIRTALEKQADAIGLSALLVSTSQQMALIVNELQRRGMTIPVLIGGAAINEEFGKRISVNGSGLLYPGGVYYCRDAFDALIVMEKINNKSVTSNLSPNNSDSVQDRISAKSSLQGTNTTVNEAVPLVSSIPQPPFWGARVIRSAPLDEVLPYLNKKALFRLSWGAKNAQGKKWDELCSNFEARMQDMLAVLHSHPWLELKAAYGYYPVQSDAESILVFDPESAHGFSREIARFTFPRQSSGEKLCLADYFLPIGSGKIDVLALQVVTVGQSAIDQINHFYSGSDFSEGYYAHGLAVQLTEALAEYIHNQIRTELGLAADRSKRFSWGYPALPDLSQHAIVFDLLPARQELDMQLTSAFQLVPELSTAAMIVHHPQATYFTMH